MSLTQQFIDKAKKLQKRIVLPEGSDERMVLAAVKLAAEGIAKPILIGKEDEVKKLAAGASLDGVTIASPATSPDLDRYAQAYADARGKKLGIAKRLVQKDLFFGAMMVSTGDADAMVAGVANATAAVISAAALSCGFKEGISQPSSFFIMVLPDGRPLVFADCAVVIDPNAQELAEIAVVTAENAKKLLGIAPKVAMLSFSTKGSASHDHVTKVREATEIARKMAPQLEIDGELQLDSAIVESVAKKKCPGSPLAGKANVLVFPDLNSGNIGYKLTQRLAGAAAIGPIMQGFKNPVNDLSRGATVEDIVAVSAIASLQAQ